MTNTEVTTENILASSSMAIFMGQGNNRREWEAVTQPFTTCLDPQHGPGVKRCWRNTCDILHVRENTFMKKYCIGGTHYAQTDNTELLHLNKTDL